jgi:hypothetical protein
MLFSPSRFPASARQQGIDAINAVEYRSGSMLTPVKSAEGALFAWLIYARRVRVKVDRWHKLS